MTEAELNAKRAATAAKAVFDGRGNEDMEAILLTIQHALATVLITACNRDAHLASILLNESVGPGTAALLRAYHHQNVARVQ